MEIELGGVEFYRRGAERAEQPALKELFGRLAGMERGHIEVLNRRYHAAPSTVPASGISLSQIAVYADADAAPDSLDGLLELAIQLETRARNFFAAEGARLPAGSPQQSLYQELEAEEQEHIDLLIAERAQLSRGRPGLL
jgi:rubrerythrin